MKKKDKSQIRDYQLMYGPPPTDFEEKPKTEAYLKATKLIKETTMPPIFWQEMMLDLLDDHPELSDYISEYLKP